MKKALVCGAGGFIGGHLVKRLKEEGFWVRGVDIKEHEYSVLPCDEFVLGDLKDVKICESILTFDNTTEGFDEVYQLAADMGGAGYIFSGEHDADVMHNSAIINLNMTSLSVKKNVKKIFYSSYFFSYFFWCNKRKKFLCIQSAMKTYIFPELCFKVFQVHILCRNLNRIQDIYSYFN